MNVYLPGYVPDAQSVLMFLLPLHDRDKRQSLCPPNGRSVLVYVHAAPAPIGRVFSGARSESALTFADESTQKCGLHLADLFSHFDVMKLIAQCSSRLMNSDFFFS